MANFAVRGDAVMTALPGVVDGMNAAVVYANAAADYNAEQVTLAGQQVTLAATQAGNSAGSAALAAASALTALNAPGTSGTSVTSLTIGAGAQTFTTQTGKAWAVGQPAIIASTSAPGTTRMSGTVTAYNAVAGAMTVAVDTVLGTGTYTDWTISLGTARAPDSLPIQVITSSTTAVVGFHYVLATAGITLTLPASLPAKDLCIAFSNASGATTTQVDFNGLKLRGRLPGVMRLNSLDSRAMLQSTGNATYGWA
jgi:hypothetical protein